MSTLVYALAYGEKDWQQCRLMVQSLREFGQFDGTIYVFTDRVEPMPYASVQEELDVLALPRPHLGKSFIGKSLPVGGYERVMYVDTDLVFIKPVQPMLDFEAELLLPVEKQLTEHEDWFGFPELPPRAGSYGFSSGTIIGASRRWNHLMQIWWNALVKERTWERECGVDQPMLNHLGRSGVIDITPLPREHIHFLHQFSYPVSGSTIAVHTKDPHKLATMQCIYDLRKSLCK